jgi:hypothetical protein
MTWQNHKMVEGGRAKKPKGWHLSLCTKINPTHEGSAHGPVTSQMSRLLPQWQLDFNMTFGHTLKTWQVAKDQVAVKMSALTLSEMGACGDLTWVLTGPLWWVWGAMVVVVRTGWATFLALPLPPTAPQSLLMDPSQDLTAKRGIPRLLTFAHGTHSMATSSHLYIFSGVT